MRLRAKAEMEYQGSSCQGGVNTGGEKHSSAVRPKINAQSKVLDLKLTIFYCSCTAFLPYLLLTRANSDPGGSGWLITFAYVVTRMLVGNQVTAFLGLKNDR